MAAFVQIIDRRICKALLGTDTASMQTTIRAKYSRFKALFFGYVLKTGVFRHSRPRRVLSIRIVTTTLIVGHIDDLRAMVFGSSRTLGPAI